MICLRILGFARAVSLTMFARLSAVAWAGAGPECRDRPGAVFGRPREVLLPPGVLDQDIAYYPGRRVAMDACAGAAGNCFCAGRR